MTGYGTAAAEMQQLRIMVEVRSLNSRYQDTTLRLPRALQRWEGEVRQMVTQRLERGKITLTVEWQPADQTSPATRLNHPLLAACYRELHAAALALHAPTEGLFLKALELAGGQADEAAGVAVDWPAVRDAIERALTQCYQFRLDEGGVLEQNFRQNVARIRTLLQAVEAHDPRRVALVRERLREKVAELSQQESIDLNRFEQELIYYLEKFDIAEEKVRLRAHLDYFIETLDQPGYGGKKLNFIAQEMGREINTIGSKANDAQVQRHVVDMKEELEKIKEQTMNIL